MDIATFFKIMVDARKRSNEPNHGGMGTQECNQMIQKALQDPKVKFMIQQLDKSGCAIDPHKFIGGYTCPNPSLGFYNYGRGIVVCCNSLRFQDDVTQVIIHELIHVYDVCRVKNFKYGDCYHHACAEIRAYRLSGDCHYVREYFRGHRNLRGHEPECVRQMATGSVTNIPHCTKYITKLALDSVWDVCYNDTSPFDKAP